MVTQETRDWTEIRAAAVRAVIATATDFGHGDLIAGHAAQFADAVLAVCDEEAVSRLADQLVDESRLQSIRAEDGAAVLSAVPARGVIAQWVLASRGLLDDSGAENYAVIDMTFPDRPRGERYQFVLQRVGKLTPHEARQRAERERDEALADAGRLRERLAVAAAEYGILHSGGGYLTPATLASPRQDSNLRSLD
jgi:hypothetical protein